MSAFKSDSRLTSSDAGVYNSTAASSTSNDIAYQNYTGDNQVDLNYGQQNNRGVITQEPTSIASYSVPATDQASGAIFDNQYSTFKIGDDLHAVFYTDSVGANYAPGDSARLNLQEFDDAGNLVSGPSSLNLNGKHSIKDLYQVSESARADFNNAVVAAYSTYNPQSGKSEIAYQKFDDSGDPLRGGVIAKFDDGTHHGLDFGTFYDYKSETPDYLLQYRSSNGETLHSRLYSTDLHQNATSLISNTGPDGEASTSLDKYDYLRPEAGGANNYSVFSQTFKYTDAQGTSHEEIALETVDPNTLAVQATTQFEVASGNTTGVGMQHLANGNFVAAFSDGGQTVLKKFDSNLDQIGSDFSLPHDNGGFDNIVSAGHNAFQVYWREYVDPGTSNVSVRHSQVFTG